MMSALRRLTVVPALAAATVVTTVLATASPAAAVTPPRLDLAPAIEPMAAYQPQFLCRSTLQPGVAAFRSLVLRTYRGTASVSDVRSCTSEAGTSEHKDGRAWDWGVNVANAAQKAQGQALLSWLLATDRYGNKAAMARRLGVMYVIWNKQIWGSYNSFQPKPYSCSGVTGCHQDHMHFSFGWAGAYQKTSYWTRKVAAVMPPPIPVLDSLATTMTVRLSSRVAKVWAPQALRAGRTYSYRASGVWQYGAGSYKKADARCIYRPDGKGWRQERTWLTASYVWSWRPTTDTGGGCNTKDHTYVATVRPGVSDAITVGIADTMRSDNAGTLTLAVKRVA